MALSENVVPHSIHSLNIIPPTKTAIFEGSIPNSQTHPHDCQNYEVLEIPAFDGPLRFSHKCRAAGTNTTRLFITNYITISDAFIAILMLNSKSLLVKSLFKSKTDQQPTIQHALVLVGTCR